MARYVIGDIHGGYKALIQVLSRASFDYEKDLLISMGDICDGWSETCECFEELLKIKNLKLILGNHDQIMQQYHKATSLGNKFDDLAFWYQHGGQETVASYKGREHLMNKHVDFLKSAELAYVDENDTAFVHAGVTDNRFPLDKQADYLWTRYFYEHAIMWHKQSYNFSVKLSENTDRRVKQWYVGHTPTISFKRGYRSDKPIKLANITFVDTGAAFTGVLSLMNLDTLELYQSDRVCELYPDEKGRNKESYNQQVKKRDNTSLW